MNVYDQNGNLLEHWDDATQTVTYYQDGEQTSQRPYTTEESAAMAALAAENEVAQNKSTIETNLEADLAAMQAILDQTNANLRADPSQEIKEIAKAIRRLTRMALDDFSGTE